MRSKTKPVVTVYTIEEVLNQENVYTLSYLNLDNKEIQFYGEDEEKPKNVLLLPYKEELCSYYDAMNAFLEEYALVVSDEMSKKQYVAQSGYMPDFNVFWNKKAANTLEKWLIEQILQIKIVA